MSTFLLFFLLSLSLSLSLSLLFPPNLNSHSLYNLELPYYITVGLAINEES